MRRTGRSRGAALLVTVSLLLAGCSKSLAVELASTDEQLPSPSFKISEPKQKDGPRYDTVTVVDQDDKTVWKLRARPFRLRAQPQTLTYGESPSGFSTLVEPHDLVKGATYRLIVEGKAVGGLRFKVDPNGLLSAQKPKR